MYSRSTAGSRYSPSLDDWFSSRAILPSAQSDAPLNIRMATAQRVGVRDQQQVDEDRDQRQTDPAEHVGHRQEPVVGMRPVHGR